MERKSVTGPFALVLAVALAAAAAPAGAADDWLELVAPSADETDWQVQWRRGEALAKSDELPYVAAQVERLEWRQAARVSPLEGREGEKPLARFSAGFGAREGTAPLVVLTQAMGEAVLSPAEWSARVVAEGLAGVPAQVGRPQRERHWQFLKVLGTGNEEAEGDLYHRVAGQQFELVLQANPALLTPGEALPVQVLFDGKAVAGLPVVALRAGPAGQPPAARVVAATDARGLARVVLDAPGEWLVRATSLRPCKGAGCASTGAAGGRVDWEAFRAAYRFTVRDGAPAN